MLILVLTAPSAHAVSPLHDGLPPGSNVDESVSDHIITNAFKPYLQDTAAIRQKFYEHLLQSEEFIRLQSLIEYCWALRMQE